MCESDKALKTTGAISKTKKEIEYRLKLMRVKLLVKSDTLRIDLSNFIEVVKHETSPNIRKYRKGKSTVYMPVMLVKARICLGVAAVIEWQFFLHKSYVLLDVALLSSHSIHVQTIYVISSPV
jgi:hypothetical protein